MVKRMLQAVNFTVTILGLGVVGKSMAGGKLHSLCRSTKSGEKLLAPAPKNKEQGIAPLQEWS